LTIEQIGENVNVFITLEDYRQEGSEDEMVSDGQLPFEEFQYFTGQLNGVELALGWHSILQPKNADYAIAVDDFDAPVSHKNSACRRGRI
jgi:hypothetical protein